MNRSIQHHAGRLILGWLAAVVAAVAQADTAEPLPGLRTRVEAYWRAQEREDWHTLFRLLSPRYLQGLSQNEFVEAKNRLEKLRFSAITIGRIERQGDYAWAEVDYGYQPRGYPDMPAHRARIWDIWQQEQNQYYPVPPESRQSVPGLPPVERAAAEEQALTQRLHQFWEARERQDQAGLYRLLDPAWRRQVDFQAFRKKRPFYQYLVHKLDWVEVPRNQRQGRVRVTFSYKLNDPSVSKMPPREESLLQDWIKVGDQWYRSVPQEPEQPVSNPEPKGDKGA